MSKLSLSKLFSLKSSLSDLFQQFRPFLIVGCFAIGLSLPFVYNLGSALAEKLDPRKKTQDLDTKDEALAREEAALLASLDDTQAEAQEIAEESSESEHASIDLRKVADSIVHSEESAAPVVKAKANPTRAQAKPVEEKPVVAQEARQPIIQKEVIREIVKESDPELKEQVIAMGNLFGEWQSDFEKKHKETLNNQRESASALQKRIESLEGRMVQGTEISSTAVEELRREWADQKLALNASKGDLTGQFEKIDATMAQHTKTLEEQIKKVAQDYSKTQALITEQQAALKATRLAEGQLKHRVAKNEGDLGDAVREISSVKESVDRIEVSLAELSNQFLDSLKYRPHNIHQVSQEWSDYDYDWGKPQPRYTELPHNAVMSDMPLVTVTEETANLWSGPEEDDKIITTMRRGGQLAVEALEHDWYRVILADGRRAWIPARAVIHNNPVGTDTALRIASAN